MKKFNLQAKTKKEKAALIKGLMAGTMTLECLTDGGTISVNMWKDDTENPGHVVTFDGSRRMTREAFEATCQEDGHTFVTLNLNS